jgi:hypothetical protein
VAFRFRRAPALLRARLVPWKRPLLAWSSYMLSVDEKGAPWRRAEPLLLVKGAHLNVGDARCR